MLLICNCSLFTIRILRLKSDCICTKPSRTFYLNQDQIKSPFRVWAPHDLASYVSLTSSPYHSIPCLPQSRFCGLFVVPSIYHSAPLSVFSFLSVNTLSQISTWLSSSLPSEFCSRGTYKFVSLSYLQESKFHENFVLFSSILSDLEQHLELLLVRQNK